MGAVYMWFDPICPWAWIASQWLFELERVRDVQVQYRVMSLSVLNEGLTGLTEAETATYRDGWGPVRVAMVTYLSLGQPAVRDFYRAIGPLIHRDSMPVGRDLYARALNQAGLPQTLANAAHSPFYDDELRASHHSGLDALGGIAACPVIHVQTPAGDLVPMVGPVLTAHPRGEAAGRLWDAVVIAAGTDGFVDLRRRATGPPKLKG